MPTQGCLDVRFRDGIGDGDKDPSNAPVETFELAEEALGFDAARILLTIRQKGNNRELTAKAGTFSNYGIVFLQSGLRRLSVS
ncbi:MAG: hypothetical protein WA194_01115 [Patescibacteria group bacterium]